MTQLDGPLIHQKHEIFGGRESPGKTCTQLQILAKQSFLAYRPIWLGLRRGALTCVGW